MAAADYIQVAQQLYLAYFGRPADRSGLINMTNALNAAGAPTTAQGIADAYQQNTNATVVAILNNFGASDESKALYGSGTDTQFIAAVYQQVLNRLPDLEGLDFWTAALGNGSMTRANAATQIIAAALKDGGDATDAATVSNKVTVSTNFTAAIDTVEEIIGYNGDAAAAQARALVQAVTDTTDTAAYQATVDAVLDSIAHPVVPGQTYALTTGADFLTGTNNNDTFNAAFSAAGMSFDSSDSLNGGAGTDTLNITVGSGATGTHQAAQLSNIENVVVNFAAAGTVSLVGSTGVNNITVQGPTTAANVTGINSTTVGLKTTNTSQNVTYAFAAAAVAGTTDSATLTLSSVTGGTHTIAGVETLNIVSTGSANTTTLATAAATKYVVSGDTDLTLGAVGAGVVTVDASALNGALSVSTGGAASTVTGGAGNDSITLTAAVNDVIDGGAGDDTVVTGGFLTTGDTLTGGAGTDILSGTSANLTGSTFTKITGFETLTVTDALGANLTTENVAAGVNTVNLAAGSGTFTVALEAGSKTVNVAAANTGDLTVSSAGTATTDAVTVNNKAAAASVFGGNDIIASGVETLTVNGTGTGAATTQVVDAVTVTASTGGTATVNFTGTNSFTTGIITAGVIDASGLTGDAVLTMGAAAASGLTKITGSAGADTLVGDAASSIDGGAGNDTVTGGTGNDTLLGGDGADTITADTGADSILGGAGNDTLVLGANYTTGDVIDGGDGVDTLSLSSASLDAVNLLSFSAVGALNAALNNVERIAISDSMVITGGSLDMARLDGINHVTFQNQVAVAANSLIGIAANSTFVFTTNTASTNDLSLTLTDATGSADAINLVLTNDTDTTNFGDVTLASIETVNISTAETTSAANTGLFTFDLTATGVTTVNISGTEGVDLHNVAINATTINAATSEGSIYVLGGSANQTITGSTVADTIDGGTGSDTIDGGAGADVLLGGTGADAITGGNGADTITGGTGNDTITLTETTAAVDDVVIGYSEAGASVDTIIGFTTTSTGDELQFDLSDLNAAGTSGIFGSATTLANGAGTAVGAGASVAQAITGATTLGATTNVIVLRGATFADASEVEDAIEQGGAFELDGTAAAFGTANNSYIVVYSDGTNTHVAAIHAVTETTVDTDFEAGDTNVIDLAIINGVASIGSSTFASGNFEFIA